MAAIEYGSFYWCVVLKEREPGAPAETIHLHADGVAVEPTGALTFVSKGRRPAGTEPESDDRQNGHVAATGGSGGKTSEPAAMIYFAVAPRLVEARLRRQTPGWISRLRRALERRP